MSEDEFGSRASEYGETLEKFEETREFWTDPSEIADEADEYNEPAMEFFEERKDGPSVSAAKEKRTAAKEDKSRKRKLTSLIAAAFVGTGLISSFSIFSSYFYELDPATSVEAEMIETVEQDGGSGGQEVLSVLKDISANNDLN